MENNLLKIMQKRGLSYRQLSAMTGWQVAPSTIQYMAHGRPPTLLNAIAVANALKMPLAKVFPVAN